jgi:hypothetical protein
MRRFVPGFQRYEAPPIVQDVLGRPTRFGIAEQALE